MGDESLKIIGLSETTDIEKEIEGSDNLVFMKVSRNFDRLKVAWKTGNMEMYWFLTVERKIRKYFDISHLEKDDIHYFSTMLLKRRNWTMEKVYFIGAGPGDPELITIKRAKNSKRSRYHYICWFFSTKRGSIECHKEEQKYNSASMTLEEVMDVTVKE